MCLNIHSGFAFLVVSEVDHPRKGYEFLDGESHVMILDHEFLLCVMCCIYCLPQSAYRFQRENQGLER